MLQRLLALLSLPLVISACVPNPGPSEPYPFVGRWDCGAKMFSFTNSTYSNSAGTYPILSVSRDGRNYTLRFANGYVIALVAVTETGLTWVSGTTGDQFNCRRVN